MIRIYLSIILFASISIIGNAQTVSTWVGPAVNDDMIFDNHGNIFGSDFNNGVVYKVEPNGTVTPFVSGLTNANGLAFDDDENLFVVDFSGNKIVKVDPGGNSTDFITGLTQPSGLIKMLNEDTLIFTSYQQNALYKASISDGTVVPFVSGGELDGPVGLHYTDGGDLLIANFDNNKVFRVEADNSLTRIYSIPISPQTTGFIEVLDDHIYATMLNANKIYRANFDGEYVLIAGSFAGSTDGDVSVARFRSPNGILKSLGGDSLFISEFSSVGIRVITGLDPTVGIEQMLPPIIQDLVVYPNPAIDYINFDFYLFEPLTEIQIEIIDLSGRIVQQKNWSNWFDKGSNQLKIELSDNLANGKYLYQLRDEGRLLAGGNIQIQ